MLDRFPFRQKILFLVLPGILGLILVTGAALLLNQGADDQLSKVQETYLPLLEADRDLKALFEKIRATLQAAAEAAEESGLKEADALHDRFVERLARDRMIVAANGADPDALLREFQDYYQAAREVSARLAGTANEELVAKMEAMLGMQQRFLSHLDAATTPDRARMAAGFRAARDAHTNVVVVGGFLACAILLVTLTLSWRIIRSTVRSLAAVQQGAVRLAEGDFAHEIKMDSRDEFGDLARQANQTAGRLREYRDQRAREDWIKGGVADLTAVTAGDVEPAELGQKALVALASYLGATMASLYDADAAGDLHLLATYAYAKHAGVPDAFRPGEGIIGQVALDGKTRVISDVPPGYVTIRSSLGEAPPRYLVLLPFTHQGRTMGVLELGSLGPWAPDRLELLDRIRDPLGLAFAVARARQHVRQLLERTQVQAEELQNQQEELRQANEELELQTQDLEGQRRDVLSKNRELETSQQMLREKADELARASRYKSEFLANMSHELRTPLNSVMILSQMLGENADRNLTERQLEFADVIHKSGAELLALINEVLDLSKIESGKQELVLESVDLDGVAAYLRGMFGPLAGRKGLSLVTDGIEGLPANLRHVRTDRARLEQILKNLVSNAIKFTEGGAVTLTAFDTGGGALGVSVADTGVGIPRDKQEVIFEAFAQADGSTSRKYGGTGLGLAIAKQLANRLGGDLRVQSDAGKGSTFTLYLPLRSAGGGDEAAPGRPVHHEPSAFVPALVPAARIASLDDRNALTPGDPSLLIIEDDAPFAMVVLGLVRDAGFRGLVASDGHSGVELARRYKPSGIILDVRLPDTDGWSVMERLKADPATEAIPVHFLTAAEGAERARAMGAVGFTSKPAGTEEIKAAIARLEETAGVLLRQVLIVEDDPTLRESLRLFLRGRNTRVEAVGSIPEAAARLRANSFGCIVLDLGLPDKESGIEFLSSLRADERTAGIPVIVHTGLELTPAEVKALEGQAQTVVVLKGERSAERVTEELRLFLHRIRKDLPEQRKKMTERVHGQEPAFVGKKVLVVDDDMRNVYSLSSVLRAKSFEVIVAADGQEALDQLVAHPDSHIVLMDMMMPHMDGYEAIRRIREQPRFQKLPIISLTAKTMPGDREKCVEAGASDYIPKPVDMGRLHSMLRVWLSG